MTRLAHTLAALVLALVPLGAFAQATSEPDPEDAGAASTAPQPIVQLNATLIEIMRRADELGYDGRFERVSPVVHRTFDLSFMAAKTIGRTWRELDDAQRSRWVETFARYTISNFADRFDGFSGETFEVVGERPASHRTRVVVTRLVRPGSDDVELGYRMREADDGWKVVDIYSDGRVSEIALRRSEYAAVLEKGGIERLIESVARKTAERAAR